MGIQVHISLPQRHQVDSWGKASNNRTNDGHNMKTKMLIVIAVLRIHVSYQKNQYKGSKHHLLLSGCVGKLYYN